MQKLGIKSLKQVIVHATPEAQAYWAELRAVRQPAKDAAAELDTCPECQGYGYVRVNLPVGHPKFGQLFPCPLGDKCPTLKTLRDERYSKLSTVAQIPVEYQTDDMTFAGWQNLEQYPDWVEGKRGALGAALAFVAARERGYRFTLDEAAELGGIDAPEFDSSPKCSIVFAGINGVGKTSLAVAIARELLDNGEGVVYLRFAEFFDGLKERFKPKASYEYGGDEADDEAEYMRQYQQAPVLVLDEFYSEATPWRKDRAEQLVNYRYTHQLPTLITTNLSSDDLTELWGKTTGHRMQAMAHWIEVGGKELRPRARKWTSR